MPKITISPTKGEIQSTPVEVPVSEETFRGIFYELKQRYLGMNSNLNPNQSAELLLMLDAMRNILKDWHQNKDKERV